MDAASESGTVVNVPDGGIDMKQRFKRNTVKDGIKKVLLVIELLMILAPFEAIIATALGMISTVTTVIIGLVAFGLAWMADDIREEKI